MYVDSACACTAMACGGPFGRAAVSGVEVVAEQLSLSWLLHKELCGHILREAVAALRGYLFQHMHMLPYSCMHECSSCSSGAAYTVLRKQTQNQIKVPPSYVYRPHSAE